MNFNSLDFQSIWEDTMGWNTYLPDSRKFNDKIESDFWIRLAPLYTEKYNLNADTDKIAAKLHELLGDNHSILEIGCGSGNFTMLMAEYSRKVHGVDFSPAMLEELHKRAEAAGIGNVTAEVSNGKIMCRRVKAITLSASIPCTGLLICRVPCRKWIITAAWEL